VSTPVLRLAPATAGNEALPLRFRIAQGWRGLFLLKPAEASFAVRRFHVSSPDKQARLERIGETFISGFNRALQAGTPAELRRSVEELTPELRGFAIEGAAMGYAISDALMLGGGRLRAWLEHSADDFGYLAHVGAGWALARVPWRRSAILRHLDPVHVWLAFDGLGFHDAYFYPTRIAGGWRRLSRDYAARAYDQGVGRAAWFSSGGDIARTAAAIARLDTSRHDDLWAGLGLAVSYAGGASTAEVQQAREAAGGARLALAQGAAFAAEARARAHHVPPHTSEAVRILTGLDPDNVVQIVRRIRQSLPPGATEAMPAYERWRLGVRQALASEATGDEGHAHG
jgi:hypothetical protein